MPRFCLLAFALSGCSLLSGSLTGEPRLNEDPVVAAVHELEGQGNAIVESQPDPTEGVVRTPVFAHGWSAQVELVDIVFAPLADVSGESTEARREVSKRICEWDIRTGRVAWSRSLGEALDEKACVRRAEPELVYVDPGVKYAFAQVLVGGHPRQDELLDELRFQIADTIGGTHEIIGFNNSTVGDHTPHLGTQDSGLWEGTGWYDDPQPRVRAYVFHAVPIGGRSVQELVDTIAILSSVPESSPRHAEAQARLQKATALWQWKAAAEAWVPGRSFTGPAGETAAVQKALATLDGLGADDEWGAQARQRIAEGRARLTALAEDTGRRAAEAKAEVEKAAAEQERAAAEEKRFITSLRPDERRVYEELGTPTANEPGPAGGRVWRYEETLMGSSHDHDGHRIVIGYRFAEYVFDVKGKLIERHFATR